MYFNLPVCIILWVFNLWDCVNDFPHISQENGRSPECISWNNSTIWIQCISLVFFTYQVSLVRCQSTQRFSTMRTQMNTFIRNKIQIQICYKLQNGQFFACTILHFTEVMQPSREGMWLSTLFCAQNAKRRRRDYYCSFQF